MKTKHHGQMSESFLTAVFLSLSGGLQDAYTYLFRGKVFANAQTGNIVLLSTNIMDGRWDKVLHYLVPLCAFALGVLAAEKMREHFQAMQRLHWRQLVVLGEVLLLFAVGFLPQSQNLLANAIVSFSCAMQVQAFRKVNGYAFASTMCIGDLRSGVEAFCIWRKSHEPHAKDRMVRYFGIIFLFALGAGLGSKSAAQLGGRAIWISCCFLLVSFALMFIREELEENPVIEKDLTAIRQETREIDRTLKQELQEEQRQSCSSAARRCRRSCCARPASWAPAVCCVPTRSSGTAKSCAVCPHCGRCCTAPGRTTPRRTTTRKPNEPQCRTGTAVCGIFVALRSNNVVRKCEKPISKRLKPCYTDYKVYQLTAIDLSVLNLSKL